VLILLLSVTACGRSELPDVASIDGGGHASLDGSSSDAAALPDQSTFDVKGDPEVDSADCSRDAEGIRTEGLCCEVQSDCEPGPGPWFICCIHGECIDCMR
jgi:hypothetical protein